MLASWKRLRTTCRNENYHERSGEYDWLKLAKMKIDMVWFGLVFRALIEKDLPIDLIISR